MNKIIFNHGQMGELIAAKVKYVYRKCRDSDVSLVCGSVGCAGRQVSHDEFVYFVFREHTTNLILHLTCL